MSRVSKAGRYTEEIEKINAQKIIDSQERFTAQWEKATGTSDVNLQLERISESDISSVLVHGYPASTWSEPEPDPVLTISTMDRQDRTTRYGETVTTKTVVDPSINSGMDYNNNPEPVTVISLPSIYGGQFVPGSIPTTTTTTTTPTPTPTCPANVQIINIDSGIIAREGMTGCRTIEIYTQDPNYRVVYLDEVPEEVFEKPEEDFPEDLPKDDILYPLSANVKITFTEDIGGFTSSIPIDDIGELQVRDNASGDWRYTLLGQSSNAPLTTLNGLINQINDLLSQYIPPPVKNCVDVYRLSNGDVVSVRESITNSQLQGYLNDGLLVRGCEEEIPTSEYVRQYYGYEEPDDNGTTTVIPTPGKFNTNILVGLIAGGALAVPILDDLLKTKKKGRR